MKLGSPVCFIGLLVYFIRPRWYVKGSLLYIT
jgi:hypothetical protein